MVLLKIRIQARQVCFQGVDCTRKEFVRLLHAVPGNVIKCMILPGTCGMYAINSQLNDNTEEFISYILLLRARNGEEAILFHFRYRARIQLIWYGI